MEVWLEGCRLPGLENPPGVSETRQALQPLRRAGRIADAVVPRKASKYICCRPYRKPTQVGEMSILRRVEEPWLRNSANWHRTFGIRCASSGEGDLLPGA